MNNKQQCHGRQIDSTENVLISIVLLRNGV